MKKKILVPTDFSKNAWRALVYACDLYKNQACEFYILNVYQARGFALDSMMVPEPGESSFERAKEESNAGLERVQSMLDFRPSNSKHNFVMISQYNSILEGMKDIIKKRDIDLVVMGTKGDTNAENIAFGSNAVDAMEKIRSCPVLAVPIDAANLGIQEIVFPTNFKTPFKHRELQCMTEIAEISKANVAILQVSKSDILSSLQENYKRLLEENLEHLDYSFHRLSHKNVGDAVQAFVESRASDLIAFVNSKHFLFGSIFSNPLVKELGMHAKVPILAMHTVNN